MKKLSDIYEKDRPRERLKIKGPGALKNHELIAVILGRGIEGSDVLEMSKDIERILDGSFDSLSLKSLMSVKGIGEAKALQILAVAELGRRYLSKKSGKKITCAEDVWNEVYEYGRRKQEYLITLTLDGAGYLIEKRVVTIGILDRSLVHPREVFVDAITDRSAGLIMVHNHPSGQLFPSREDRRITERISRAGELLGIELLDHIIVTKEGWYSFAEEGDI